MSVFHAAALALAIAVTFLLTPLFVRGNSPPAVPATRAIMQTVIGPAADALFQAVTVRQTAGGEVEEGPTTEQAWLALELRAAMLAEGANLLLIPRRAVPADRLLHLDRDRWNRYAVALRDAAVWSRDAARARSTLRLLATGGDLSLACEQCHLVFRTPGGRRYLPPDAGH